jgi:lipopolysaccharide/colanic/teichoic acid biosynthesis glycosyltransferase
MLIAAGIFALFFGACFLSASAIFVVAFQKDILKLIASHKKSATPKPEINQSFAAMHYKLIEKQSYVLTVKVFSSRSRRDLKPVIISHDRQPVSYAKEIFDRAGAAIALILLAPLFLFLAIGIKLSSKGPVFYRQPRRGVSGTIFYAYKFRTMFHSGEPPVTINDKAVPRITKLGFFMRRHSLDELPQFFNVLWGEMSLVGPRPYMPSEDDFYASSINGYVVRYTVKPGVTGWAQVYSHGADHKINDAERQTKLDIKYIQLHNVWLDLKILICVLIPALRDRLLNW